MVGKTEEIQEMECTSSRDILNQFGSRYELKTLLITTLTQIDIAEQDN